ncbi:cytochrome c [Rhodocyclus tenuis]|uniref:Cytochrome c553 n=1 Tax=Rhodocyclus tenuis TaxID=1066 RepID=A0A840G5S5_RHOTE|nr:cytochrome c [Rhodocyclus tenuis]MBB4247723.1 cytochrome c553 [Rhodocyclus tenuis]MBK1680996.1 cytochrome C [Rhodocyclus tenuis]
MKSTTLCLLALLASVPALAEDERLFAPLPAPAQEVLREQMLDNLLAVNEIVSLLASGGVKEAGVIAENRLGLTAMGKNRTLPFDARPGVHMPPAMHAVAFAGHRAASEFAAAAASGDRDRALALLPNITGTCVACHLTYRTR